MRSVPRLLLCFVAALASVNGHAQSAADFVRGPLVALQEPVAAAVAEVRAPALEAHIAFLASPALEGRGLGSPGFEAAAEYVAAQLALTGIPPLMPVCDGCTGAAAYAQEVPLREVTERTGTLTLTVDDGVTTRARVFASGVDLVLPNNAAVRVSAPLVFAGYGIREPALDRDDYRGIDARGKVVVVLAGLPPDPAWQTPELVKLYAADDLEDRYSTKLATAQTLGAAVLVVVEDASWATRLAEEALADRLFESFSDGAAEITPPVVPVSPAVATFLAEAIGTNVTLAEVAPVSLPHVTAALSVGGKERALASRNIIATLPGSDPELRDEAVILGAHLDHLGRVGAQVYPGADDNASGVAALLEIARVFGTMEHRPRRTLVFAFWTGEEEGKFGSGHWVRHPMWPLASTVTYINIDMIGHPWLIEEIRELVSGVPSNAAEAFLDGLDPANLVEVGLPPGNELLAGTLRTVALGTGFPLHLDRTDGRNGGSDYRDFARAGLPFLRFFGNFFPGYHEPDDTPDRVDPAQVQRVARFCLATALLLADQGSSTSAYQPRETMVVP